MITIDIGNTRGSIRCIDKLGRVVIPKDFRKELNWNEGDATEIFLLEDGIYVKSRKK